MAYLPNITANIRSADSPSIDGFARQRVSEPFTIFDSKQLHEKDTTIYWSEVLNGNATSVFQTGNAEVLMSTTTSGDYAIRQTKSRFNYQPGKSQLNFLTFLISSQTNITKRVGLFHGGTAAPYNSFEGIYLENASGTVTLNIGNANGTQGSQSVSQASWNVDPFDGSGPSGYTLNWSTCNIMIIDYEWLGVGRIRIGFVINGIPYYAHYFNNANSVTNVYCSTPNFPVRYEIRQTGAGSGSLHHICSSVQSEGGIDPNGPIYAINSGGAVAVANGSNEPIVGYQLKSTHLDISTIVTGLSMYSADGNDDMRWYLTLNPTMSGTPTATAKSNTGIEILTNNNNTITNEGFVIAEGYLTSANNEITDVPKTTIRVGSTIGGTRDQIWLCVEDIGGSAGLNVRGSIIIQEL